ncbi:MAG: hypothetical protein HYX62_07865 [Gammaproteobacteria bacterium]|nr:hypothetical protein [Gammaproteobacteria bacterium]
MSDKYSTDQFDPTRERQEALQEDEISLIDLWRVIIKRKKMIIGSLLLSLLLVGAWIAITKPVYESRAVLGIGQVVQMGQVVQVEASQLLVQRLKEEYRVKDDSEGEQKFPMIKEVKTMEKSLPNGVEIIAQAYEAQEAQKFLVDVAAKVIKKHQTLFDIGRTEQQRQLESLQNEHDRIEQALSLIEHRVSSLVGSEASLAGLLTLQKDLLLQRLPQIEQQQIAVRLAMSELQSRPSVLLRQPTLPIKPVKPKPALYLALATVLGLMLGVFGAFFAEFVGKTRARMAVN